MFRVLIFLCALVFGAYGMLPRPTNVPAELNPPQSHYPYLEYRARGVQIYTCSGGTFGASTPDALLYSKKTAFSQVHHYAGPTWENIFDGSKVMAAAAVKVDSPSGSIPWLLLNVIDSSGTGLLGNTTFIQRIRTTGGVAPAKCKNSDTVRVPYTALYVFYVAINHFNLSASLPATLMPPSNAVVIGNYWGSGVQIYTCNGTDFVFTSPLATLNTFRPLNSPDKPILHSAGPQWTNLEDGSYVNGTTLVKQAAPNPVHDIAWLLLQGNAGGTGQLSGVAFIQRVQTVGGQAPAKCAMSGQELRVPYEALYRFWTAS